jgi:AcrR family transcriptional regulator
VKRRPYQLKQRAENAEETRRRIIDATFLLHVENGIAATTMKQIAERAGVGIGTVYHHFPVLEDTVAACAHHVEQSMPMPTEAVFSGIAPMKDRVLRLASALFGYFDRVSFEIVLADQDKIPLLRQFAAAEQEQRIELTRAALAPFAIDRDLIRIVAALLDVAVYRSLQRAGFSLDQAAAAITDVIQARLTRKD